MPESVPDARRGVTMEKVPQSPEVVLRCMLDRSNPSHPRVELADIAQDLRATSDALVRDLEVLSSIEAQKRKLDPDDPRLVELSERVEALAARLLDTSTQQRHLTEVGVADVDAGADTAPEASIDETPRPIPDILAEWRAAERRLAAAEPGSAEALEAQATSDHLRQEYRHAYEAHRR